MWVIFGSDELFPSPKSQSHETTQSSEIEASMNVTGKSVHASINEIIR